MQRIINSDMLWLDGGEGGCAGAESCNLNALTVKISNMNLSG